MAHVPRAWALGLSIFTVVSSFVHDATSSENYPAIIDRQKGVECPRPLTRCLICHDTAAGGEETANQPFARALVMEYELTGKSGRDLAMAIESWPDDVDTDGDGTPDQAELAGCGNPSGEELSEGPGFGCNARLAGSRSGTPVGLGLVLAGLLAFARGARLRRVRSAPRQR